MRQTERLLLLQGGLSYFSHWSFIPGANVHVVFDGWRGQSSPWILQPRLHLSFKLLRLGGLAGNSRPGGGFWWGHSNGCGSVPRGLHRRAPDHRSHSLDSRTLASDIPSDLQTNHALLQAVHAGGFAEGVTVKARLTVRHQGAPQGAGGIAVAAAVR